MRCLKWKWKILIFFCHVGPDGSLVHRCDCCLKYFGSDEERNAHRDTEHKEKLSCRICNRTFGNLRCLAAHNRAHHKGKEVTCQKCGEFHVCLRRFLGFMPILTLVLGIIVDESYLVCHQQSYCVGNGEENLEFIQKNEEDANGTQG